MSMMSNLGSTIVSDAHVVFKAVAARFELELNPSIHSFATPRPARGSATSVAPNVIAVV